MASLAENPHPADLSHLRIKFGIDIVQNHIHIVQNPLWRGLGEPALGKELMQRPTLPSEDRRWKLWLGLGSK